MSVYRLQLCRFPPIPYRTMYAKIIQLLKVSLEKHYPSIDGSQESTHFNSETFF